jgi:hypothetical protein
MGERERRLAENESIFRDVNEVRMHELEDERLEFLCECGDIGCKERIRLTPTEYESVRADARQFLLIPGHELLATEEVVVEEDRFVVVRKFGDAGDVAQELDTRSPARRSGYIR